MGVKSAIKSMPLLGPIISRLRVPQVVNSGEYWENRYATGGHSGAGSYGRLAQFKASFLNDYVTERRMQSVIEFGVGDGAQLSLSDYPRYVGVDISPTSLAMCRKKFADRPNYSFCTPDEAESLTADLTLSLDVIYHLVEDDVFERYMRQLFGAARRSVIIYASNRNEYEAPHVRHRKFTRWVERNEAASELEVVRNPYPFDPADPNNTSFADFYVYLK